ncbi:MAG: hypothetical protein C0404_05495 [Verrucomicrobia bacterium]|nr:hypothetical protein [Verrucomicrobiota bacterium]
MTAKVQIFRLTALPCAGLLAMGLTGCAGPRISTARYDFYAGQHERALSHLDPLPDGDTDRLMLLMERGMIKHEKGDHRGSVDDWQSAIATARQLDYYSVSKGGASYVVNDTVMAYRGMPYERVLLHSYSALGYMSLRLWQDAAVEARNIIYRLEHREEFPDDAYSRYLAAFCLEMVGDEAGANFQYRQASSMLAGLKIDEFTGRIAPAGTNSPYGTAPQTRPIETGEKWPDLTCFIAIGRLPSEHEMWIARKALSTAPYAEIYINDKLAGRSYAMTSTARLMADTRAKLLARQLLKDASRIAFKDTVSQAVYKENHALGELIRLILFAMEAPDTRRWETLPNWLEVARVPCPPDARSCTVVVRTPNGTVFSRKTVDLITGRDNNRAAFVRTLN